MGDNTRSTSVFCLRSPASCGGFALPAWTVLMRCAHLAGPAAPYFASGSRSKPTSAQLSGPRRQYACTGVAQLGCGPVALSAILTNVPGAIPNPAGACIFAVGLSVSPMGFDSPVALSNANQDAW